MGWLGLHWGGAGQPGEATGGRVRVAGSWGQPGPAAAPFLFVLEKKSLPIWFSFPGLSLNLDFFIIFFFSSILFPPPVRVSSLLSLFIISEEPETVGRV